MPRRKKNPPPPKTPFQTYFELTGVRQGGIIIGLGRWSWIRMPTWAEGVAGWN